VLLFHCSGHLIHHSVSSIFQINFFSYTIIHIFILYLKKLIMTDKFLNPVKSTLLASLFFFTASVMAQDGTIYPLDAPAEPNAIPLGTGGVEGQTAPESWFRQWGDPMARNVSSATLTPFFPAKGKANGAAVIVAPGGGFRWLSMGNEGWEVAQALADRGVTAFVLKYRLMPTPPTLEGLKESMERTFAAAADTSTRPPNSRPAWDLSNQLEDAEAAYALIVKRAAEWGVDTSRLGMIGFSAGAGLTMYSTLNSKTMELDFIGPIYGPMAAVDVPENAPPMFCAIASDDFLFGGQFGVINSWFNAGRPVEFHLYQNGGHGFGLGNPDRTSNRWFDAFMHWMDVNRFLVK
jgi:acetyl esterase/lipase